MSASGYKRTFRQVCQRVRFTPKKQTLDVYLTPESGRNWLWRWMSASDPEQTFVALISAKVLRGTEFTSDLHTNSIRLIRL